MSLVVSSPAKVNLFLRILGRRPDGYHELATLMQPLSLADTLGVRLGGDGLTMDCNLAELNQDNLVLKAAEAYFQALGRPARAIFTLKKRIPVAAGLGGGSSNAAHALLALNALHKGVLPPEKMASLAAGLGADVAFFLCGHTALCSGVGEMVEPWPDFPDLHYVLVNPGFAVSTAEVYDQFDLAWTNSQEIFKISHPLGSDDPLGRLLVNDLEPAAMRVHPSLGDIKLVLEDTGAKGCLMSGSGPTFFGVYADAAQAREAAGTIRSQSSWWAVACQGVKV